jgi:hypothetical protein
VRKLIKIGLVILGISAFLHWRKRRHEAQAPTAPVAHSADDPADELRRKLAETREDDAAPDIEDPPAASVADRRADVHEQGRAALDEMKTSDES